MPDCIPGDTCEGAFIGSSAAAAGAAVAVSTALSLSAVGSAGPGSLGTIGGAAVDSLESEVEGQANQSDNDLNWFVGLGPAMNGLVRWVARYAEGMRLLIWFGLEIARTNLVARARRLAS